MLWVVFLADIVGFGGASPVNRISMVVGIVAMGMFEKVVGEEGLALISKYWTLLYVKRGPSDAR